GPGGRAVAGARPRGWIRRGQTAGGFVAAGTDQRAPRRSAIRTGRRRLMLFRLAWAALSRHRSRTMLAILGVAVSAAMLLDMVMLSSGMRASFKDLLLSRGFQL